MLRNRLSMRKASESFDALIALIEGSSYLYLRHSVDGEGSPSFSLTVKSHSGSMDLASETLEKVLLQALRPLKIDAGKRCTRCRKAKSLGDFPRKPSSKDGLASHCSECDRKRKKKWYPRAARRAQRSAATNGSFQAAQQRLEVNPEVDIEHPQIPPDHQSESFRRCGVPPGS